MATDIVNAVIGYGLGGLICLLVIDPILYRDNPAVILFLKWIAWKRQERDTK